MTQEDPEFTSSRVPSGAMRIQFMVRDKKKYAATGGWGYALFSPAGFRLDATPPQEQAEACDVCHQIVKESRGEVFSQPANLSGLLTLPAPNEVPKLPDIAFAHDQASFQDEDTAKIPAALRELLPPKSESVRFIEGSLRDHVITGTVNEIQPMLIKESARSGHATLFLSRDGKQFALAAPAMAQDGLSCPAGAKPFKLYWSAKAGNGMPNAGTLMTRSSSTCYKP
jgi:hypothetical protein